jgi:hypothetical protein
MLTPIVCLDFLLDDECRFTLYIAIDGGKWSGERTVPIKELVGR